ncbi:MAG: Hpt domain-containing protein [Thermodesulfobacteriota bacterium]|nr:Hpt domain-containing protein [Thermodesulfobacteriota bacterium]
MARNKLNKQIEELAAALVETDPDNLQDLYSLQTHFLNIKKEAKKKGLNLLGRAASSAKEILEKIMLEGLSDWNSAFAILSQTVSSIQAIVRDGRGEEVTFPEGLGMQISKEEGKEDIPEKVALPPHVDEDIFFEFLSKQDAGLQGMEADVLLLERENNDDTLMAIKRYIHTLKGEAGILGFDDVERLCHVTEDFIDVNRKNLPIDRLLMVKDWFYRTFKSFEGKDTAPEPVEGIISRISAPVPDEKFKKEVEDVEKEGTEEVSKPDTSQKIQEGEKEVSIKGDLELIADFIYETTENLNTLDVQLLSLETYPGNEEVLNAVFRTFHTIKGVAGFLEMDEIAGLAHHTETLLDKARKKEFILSGNAVDVIFDAADTMKKLIKGVRGVLESGGTFIVDNSYFKLLSLIKGMVSGMPVSDMSDSSVEPDRKLGEILIDAGVVTKKMVDTALKKQEEAEEPRPKLGEMLVKYGISAKKIAQGLREQQQNKTVKLKESLRVDSARLDLLMETIGELVIISSMITHDREIRDGASMRIVKNLSQMEKITRQMQDMSLSLRMIPVRSTFQKMARMVRDLSKKAGKPIEFSMSGEDTELDKSMVDSISDPLVHLVRNAVDHGIEVSPEERLKAGKIESGHIELNAFHKGGNVYIQIKDDGRGLNRDVILARAKEQGLFKDGMKLNDREVYNLIFEPGFSTAEKVTDVSGRGVGMDVVKRNIEELLGSVEINSEPGKGSIFNLRLPLTLAIIDGMIVRVGEDRYIIPTVSIVESFRTGKEGISTVFNRGEMIKARGQLIPLARISHLFDIKNAKDDSMEVLVVVVEDNGNRIGILVDDLVGMQSTVIKSLGADMEGIPGVSGGTIMADGSVGIVLDVAGIVKLAVNGSRS